MKEKVINMGFSITSPEQIIDLSAVEAGCKTIETAAEDYVKCAQLIQEASATCTAEALSVDKTTMQPSLEELGTSVAEVKEYIVGYVNSIRAAAVQIHAAQTTEYNRYLAYLEEERQRATAAQAADNGNAS